MPQIIQFLHTAKEAAPKNKTDNQISWNNYEDHRRKFILNEGKYVNNQSVLEGNLTFWGEWEAQSHIQFLKNTRKNLPKFLNKPFINPSVASRSHNTDPYIFGTHFRYIICKQNSYNILRNLEPYSLILFGSCINKNFCLDTLFVVSKDTIKYTNSIIENVFNIRDQYYYASVNPLYDDTNYNTSIDSEDSCRIDSKKEYSFYTGVNFGEKDQYNGIYSYVPCKLHNPSREADFTFKQPVIDLKFISQNQTQGINACNGRSFSKSEIINYWNEISKQIENEGLEKGVWFKTPSLAR